MVNALRVALAITRATEEDCIAFLSVCKLDFPVIVLDQIQDAEGFYYLYFSLFSDAQYMLRVTRRPSEKRSLPVTWQTAQETRPEQS